MTMAGTPYWMAPEVRSDSSPERQKTNLTISFKTEGRNQQFYEDQLCFLSSSPDCEPAGIWHQGEPPNFWHHSLGTGQKYKNKYKQKYKYMNTRLTSGPWASWPWRWRTESLRTWAPTPSGDMSICWLVEMLLTCWNVVNLLKCC